MKRTLFILALSSFMAACGQNATLPPDRDPATDPEPEPLTCVPNLDGEISASELLPTFGVPARYVVNPPDKARKVDIGGEPDEEDSTHWDFSIDLADDQALAVAAEPLAGKWYSASFDEKGFVVPFDREGTLDSISEVRDDAFLLLGLASHEENPAEGKTLLVYDPPIVVLKLPVEVGQEYASTGNIVNGMIRGLPYAGRDTYETKVDAVGSIDLPQLTFEEVHRVTTKVTVEPAVGESVVKRQVSFFAECFGEVARVVSAEDPSVENFTQASDVRRLGL